MTTRALFVSDLHIDIERNSADDLKSTWRDLDFDVLMCAGDVRAPGHKSLEWLADANPHKPTIYTAGNHDFYSAFDKHDPTLKTTYEREIDAMRRRAEQLSITFLSNDSCLLPDGTTRLLGTTLWTDFQLRPDYLSLPDARRNAEKQMNDHRFIKVGTGRSRDKFLTKDSIAAHKVARRWLQEQLAIEHPDGDVIVMSHMAPHPFSLLHGRVTDPLDCCYSSDLTEILTGADAPTHWFHGHVHVNRDYTIGGCRVIANPRGYPGYKPSDPRENQAFNPQLIIEVGRELDLTPGMGM